MDEPAGFRDYVAARQRALLRSAWLLTGDWHAAEDIVQTALVRVWPRWTRVAAAGDPDAYVRRAVINAYLSARPRRPVRRRRTARRARPGAAVPRPAAARDRRAALLRRPERAAGGRGHGL